MKAFWETKNFQVRWNEPLGVKGCPYAYRYVLIFFGYSIRLHVWLRSDDKRYFHDHAWGFHTCVLKGHYIDVSQNEEGGIRYELVQAFKPVYRPAHHKHYVQIPENGCITILYTGKPIRKWGFWVNGKFTRPLRFFDRYGHPPCSEQ